MLRRPPGSTGRATLFPSTMLFRSGEIGPDGQGSAALEGRPFAPHGAAWDAAVAQWRGLASHPDARFDREVTVDAAEVAPMISWGTSPQQAVPITGAVPS